MGTIRCRWAKIPIATMAALSPTGGLLMSLGSGMFLERKQRYKVIGIERSTQATLKVRILTWWDTGVSTMEAAVMSQITRGIKIMVRFPAQTHPSGFLLGLPYE